VNYAADPVPPRLIKETVLNPTEPDVSALDIGECFPACLLEELLNV
jgi:hypothetical protein